MILTSVAEMRRVGTETINRTACPVFELSTGQHVVQVPDQLTGKPMLLPVAAAKQFKNGQYPVGPALRTLLSHEVGATVPFALRSEAEQAEATQKILTALFDRVRTTHRNFQFMEN